MKLFALFALKPKPPTTSSDFSDFFNKSSAERTKVIRQVLREANEEQRRVVERARTI